MKHQELNWIERFQQHRLNQDTGHNITRELRDSPLRLKLLLLLYHPYTELFTFILTIFSITVLILEMLQPGSNSVGWMNSDFDNAERLFFFVADLIITILFAAEYCIKMIVIPYRAKFFKSTFVDFLAILPLFRMFRLARSLRFLKMFRLLRALKMDSLMEYEVVRKKSQSLFQNENTTILTYLVISIMFGTVGILIFERGTNDGFTSLGDGLWWCIVTITTVGYGDISPITTGGKVVAAIIMFVGLSFYPLLTGSISSILIGRAQQYKEKKMEISLLENHIIICGWNEDAHNLIENLLETSKSYILIITPDEVPFIQGQRILIKQGDPSNKDILEESMIDLAHSAIILSPEEVGHSSQNADARSILVTLAIKICNPDVHTIIELQNEDNIQHAKNAGANEFIIPKRYKGSLLAQSAASPGIAQVFTKLFGDKKTFLYQEELKKEWIGLPYIDVLLAILDNEHSLLGIIRNQEPMLSPSPDLVLQKDDHLILLRAPAS